MDAFNFPNFLWCANECDVKTMCSSISCLTSLQLL